MDCSWRVTRCCPQFGQRTPLLHCLNALFFRRRDVDSPWQRDWPRSFVASRVRIQGVTVTPDDTAAARFYRGMPLAQYVSACLPTFFGIALVDRRTPVPARSFTGGVGREGILPTVLSAVCRMSCAHRAIGGAPKSQEDRPGRMVPVPSGFSGSVVLRSRSYVGMFCVVQYFVVRCMCRYALFHRRRVVQGRLPVCFDVGVHLAGTSR
jgi:hypothetical protein